MKPFFPVSMPSIGEKEIAYVSDAVASGWVSSIGRYIEEFEAKFAAFCGVKYALAVSNGTTGLHLAIVAAGIKPGDEVIIPDLTFVATANAVIHAGAKVVTVDIDPHTLCIDPIAIRKAVTARTRAIIPVHLYGHAAQMDSIKSLAKEHDIAVIEDAAEAHGAEFNSQRVGSLGDCGVFSFYGNKIITTGEGGMITTDRSDLYLRAKHLRDHAMSSTRRYWHTEVGYNYRITNLQAALGLAQMERIDSFLEKRRQIMEWYRTELVGQSGIRLNYEQPNTKSAFWMVCVEFEGITELLREELMSKLRIQGVDSRPYFYPVSDMPMYKTADTPVAHSISPRGINLPSYCDLTAQDVSYVCDALRRVSLEMDLG